MHGQPFYPPRYTAWVFEERFEREDSIGGQPPSWIDQREHIFRFAFYPHLGDLQQGRVVEMAHHFNQPPLYFCNSFLSSSEDPNQEEPLDTQQAPIRNHPINLPSTESPIEITAIKPPHEDSDAGGWKECLSSHRILICRTYNTSQNQTQGCLDVSSLTVKEVRECDLLERPLEEATFQLTLASDKDSISEFTDVWAPYEIKTCNRKAH